MASLLRLSRLIDAVSLRLGQLAAWLCLLAVLVSAGNAFSRYAFGITSNGMIEVQ